MMAKKQVSKLAGNQNAAKAEPRCKKVSVRFTQVEYDGLAEEAEFERVSLAEFIRGMTLPH